MNQGPTQCDNDDLKVSSSRFSHPCMILTLHAFKIFLKLIYLIQYMILPKWFNRNGTFDSRYFHCGSQLWNDLPSHLKKAHTNVYAALMFRQWHRLFLHCLVSLTNLLFYFTILQLINQGAFKLFWLFNKLHIQEYMGKIQNILPIYRKRQF